MIAFDLYLRMLPYMKTKVKQFGTAKNGSYEPFFALTILYSVPFGFRSSPVPDDFEFRQTYLKKDNRHCQPRCSSGRF